MRRNCSLELALFPPYDSDHRHRHMVEEASEISPMQQYYQQHRPQQEQHRQLTIIYDGKICVSDVTELQARTILMLASKKVEERGVRTPTGSGSEPSSPTLQSHHQMCSPSSTTGLSMKRSLQRFLQKRKNRIQEASPYHH